MTLVNGLRINGIIKHEMIQGKTMSSEFVDKNGKRTGIDYIDKNHDGIPQASEMIEDKNKNNVIDAEEVLEHIFFKDKRPEIAFLALDILKAKNEDSKAPMFTRSDLYAEDEGTVRIVADAYEKQFELMQVAKHTSELLEAQPLLKAFDEVYAQYSKAEANSSKKEALYTQLRAILLSQSKLGIHPLSGSNKYMLPSNNLIDRGTETERLEFNENGRITMVDLQVQRPVMVPGCKDPVMANIMCFSDSGALSMIRSDTTFSLEIPNGKGGTMKIKTQLAFFHENGTVAFISLDEPVNVTVYTPEKKKVSVTEIRFNTEGRVVEFTPTEPFLVTTPDQKQTFLATEAAYYENGALASATLKNDTQLTVPGTSTVVTAKAETSVYFHETGALRSLEAEPFQYTMTLGGKELSFTTQKISFFPNGAVERPILSDTIRIQMPKTAIMLDNCTEISFHQDGSIASLATDKPCTIPLPGSKRTVRTEHMTFFPSGNLRDIDLRDTPTTIQLKNVGTINVSHITYDDARRISRVRVNDRTPVTIGKHTYSVKEWGYIAVNEQGTILSIDLDNKKKNPIDVLGGKLLAVDRLFFWENGGIKRIDLFANDNPENPEKYGIQVQVPIFGNYLIYADHCIELDEYGKVIKGW